MTAVYGKQNRTAAVIYVDAETLTEPFKSSEVAY